MAPDVEEASATCPQCGCAGAEPEQDGQAGYYSCPECGADFGYHPLAQDGPLCAAGLPVRAEAAEPSGAVFLGATITRRPE